MSEKEAEEAFLQLKRTHAALDKASGGSGWRGEAASNFALGQNILREELGHFGEWTGAQYELDQSERDRILAHVRQDSAAAVAMAQSAFRDAHFAKRAAVRAAVLGWAILSLNILTIIYLIASR